MDAAWVPPDVDPARPSVARVYDFHLGGSHNVESDRDFGRRALRANLPALVLENRAFLRRVVTHLGERGIDQFLDLGSGIPTVGNVHEVAGPASTVVYVDHDPVAVAHGTTLLRADPRATSILGDIREPERVLSAASATGLLDLARPVAVLAFAVLHFVLNEERPAELIGRYTAATTPGSFLAMSQVGPDQSQARDVERLDNEGEHSPSRRNRLRTAEELAELFVGVALEEPGVVPLPLWRPEPNGDGGEHGARRAFVGGLGRRP